MPFRVCVMRVFTFQRALVRGSLVAMDILQSIGRTPNPDESRDS